MIFRVALLALLAATPVHAQEGWDVDEVQSPDARRICLARAADGAFALTVTEGDAPMVSWYGPVTDSPYDGLLVLNIDGDLLLLNASFTPNAVQALMNPMQGISARGLFERIAAGRSLAVEDEDGRVFVEVSLQGSRRAMEAMLDCADVIGASNTLDY